MHRCPSAGSLGRCDHASMVAEGFAFGGVYASLQWSLGVIIGLTKTIGCGGICFLWNNLKFIMHDKNL